MGQKRCGNDVDIEKVSESQLKKCKSSDIQKFETSPKLTFLDLPMDIIISIILLVRPQDSIAICSTSKQYRKYLGTLVLLKLKAPWHRLVDKKHIQDISNLSFVTKLRITDNFSYGEWQLDLFSTLNDFTQLKHLAINSCNSSNWLKYRLSDSIRKLILYHEPAYNESTLLRAEEQQQQQSKKRNNNNNNNNNSSTSQFSSHQVKHHYKEIKSILPKNFSLFHLNGFPNLTELLLQQYHFTWNLDEDLSTSRLKSLHLVDCTWEYPFTLSRFNTHGLLQYLQIGYNGNHPFVLLERFSKFLDYPMQNASDSIMDFHLALRGVDSSWKKVLLLKQLEKFAFKRVKNLMLEGFSLNLDNSSTYIDVIGSMEHLKSIKFRVWHTGKNPSLIDKFVLLIEKRGIKCVVEHETLCVYNDGNETYIYIDV